MEHYSPVRGLSDSSWLEFEDEFSGGGITSGAIGNKGWVETTSAAGTNSLQPGGVGKGSVFRLTTGAVSGNNKRIHLGQTATDPSTNPPGVDRFRWIVRIPTITTIVVRLGLMQDVSAANGGTAGAYVEFQPANAATWRFFTRQASTSPTPAAGPTVVAGSWYLIEADRRPSNAAWEFSVNNILIGSLTANLPTTACNFGALLQTATAAARSLDFDYAYLRADLGQRFT